MSVIVWRKICAIIKTKGRGEKMKKVKTAKNLETVYERVA